MANAISYASIFQQELDKQLRVGTTSNWMESNSNLIQYMGGQTIKIPKIILSPLADYDRATGFVNGDITFSYETFDLQMDRGRSFSFDAEDVNETNFVLTASQVMTEFQRINVIPEVDAFRYSTVAQRLITSLPANAISAAAPTSTTLFNLLNSDIAAISEYVGINGDLVITISNSTYAIMQDAGLPILRAIRELDDISLEIMTYNGFEIQVVPDARMYTEYDFTDTGFTPAAAAKQIYWEIALRTAPIGVVKARVPRIFDPTVNQTMDAYKVQYRIYHGLILPDNKLQGCFVRYAA